MFKRLRCLKVRKHKFVMTKSLRKCHVLIGLVTSAAIILSLYHFLSIKMTSIRLKVKINLDNPRSRTNEQLDVQSIPNLSSVRTVNQATAETAHVTFETKNTTSVRHNSTKLCLDTPPGLIGLQTINRKPLTWDELNQENRAVEAGHWKPDGCISRQKVAIIIPYRDRDAHLRVLLRYLHPLLQRQQLDYTIFVVEQNKPDIFSKSSIMDVGFIEARKQKFDCYIFHDVDVIPEDDRTLYRCLEAPGHVLHLGAYTSKYNYTLIYYSITGGALAMKDADMMAVNGFSTLYYGWGGEDDDMYRRMVMFAKLKLDRPNKKFCRYTQLVHGHDKGNRPNPDGGRGLTYHKDEYDRFGLNSLTYELESLEKRPLYTWLCVNIPPPPDLHTLQRNSSSSTTIPQNYST